MIITGANGGMGRACTRLLGATMDLILTDAAPALSDFTQELRTEGYTVTNSICGNLGTADVLAAVEESLVDNAGFDALIHTCGLPPSAPWRQVMEVNYIATLRLLARLEPFMRHGSAAVLVGSVAGHLAPVTPTLEALLAEPLGDNFFEALEEQLHDLAGPAGTKIFGLLSYSLSKHRVIRLCAERAQDWGSRGARIVSISPGMIYTPMGRHEADSDPLAGRLVTATPAGRWGTSMEIAHAVRFLLDPVASFITGSDLLVDGGGLASAGTNAPAVWLENLRHS
ncbi:SDR family oxidoreductase [Acidocella sp.]|uniref:SDR family oxidoreductase n=1 Tax=Acidocella sp. TaxID=50710 RepID=UPI00260817A3|nr:SDR family oxidoreductase [Acidocella sp.]